MLMLYLLISRNDLKAEFVALKNRAVYSERVLHAERVVFEKDNSSQQVSVDLTSQGLRFKFSSHFTPLHLATGSFFGVQCY